MDIFWDYTLGGINFSVPGSGGPQCVEFLSSWQRIAETIMLVPLSIYGIIISSRSLEPFVLPPKVPVSAKESMATNSGKNLIRYSVIFFYCFIFGSEVAYKLTRRVCIFLLNPCHIATILQIMFLVKGTNDCKMCFLFRFHTYLLPGALIAVAFPAVNSRVLPGEVFTYFLQHLLIIIVPFFIVYINGTFLLESFRNFAWPILSFSIILLYHYTILQFLGWMTQVNLGSVICPAVSDPFHGRFYRLATVMHQGILIPLITKIFNTSAKHIIQAVH